MELYKHYIVIHTIYYLFLCKRDSINKVLFCLFVCFVYILSYCYEIEFFARSRESVKILRLYPIMPPLSARQIFPSKKTNFTGLKLLIIMRVLVKKYAIRSGLMPLKSSFCSPLRRCPPGRTAPLVCYANRTLHVFFFCEFLNLPYFKNFFFILQLSSFKLFWFLKCKQIKSALQFIVRVNRDNCWIISVQNFLEGGRSSSNISRDFIS